MYCGRCGSVNDDSMEFCSECGVALAPYKALKTGSAVPPENAAVVAVGAPPVGKAEEAGSGEPVSPAAPRFCRRCGATLAAAVAFCERCGTPVLESPVSPAPTTPESGRGWWRRRGILGKVGVIAAGVVVLAAIGTAVWLFAFDGGKSGADADGGYAVGDVGPAGGLVFYDKGDDIGGWRYLEVAPASTEWTNAGWGPSAMNDPAPAGLLPGTGRENTAALIADQGGASEYAAALCDGLSCGGFSDWFLPSRDELALVYEQLAAENRGDFDAGYYWSSSQCDADYAWAQSFADGDVGTYLKGAPYRVRAVRAFSDDDSAAVDGLETANGGGE